MEPDDIEHELKRKKSDCTTGMEVDSPPQQGHTYASFCQADIGGGSACTPISLNSAQKWIRRDLVDWIGVATLDNLILDRVRIDRHWRDRQGCDEYYYPTVDEVLKHALLEVKKIGEIGGCLEVEDSDTADSIPNLPHALQRMERGSVAVLTITGKGRMVARTNDGFVVVDSHACPDTAICEWGLNIEEVIGYIDASLEPRTEYSTTYLGERMSDEPPDEDIDRIQDIEQEIQEEALMRRDIADMEGVRSHEENGITWFYRFRNDTHTKPKNIAVQRAQRLRRQGQTVVVLCRETGKGREYGVCDMTALEAILKCNHHLYELLSSDVPVDLYFDLEWTGLDPKRVLHSLLSVLHKEMEEMFGMAFNNEDFIILDASGPGEKGDKWEGLMKYSLHMMVRLKKKLRNVQELRTSV